MAENILVQMLRAGRDGVELSIEEVQEMAVNLEANMTGKVKCLFCDHEWDIEESKLWQYLTCECGADYTNPNYDHEAALEVRKKIKLPVNCCYDFSEGVPPCVSESEYCERECWYVTDQKFSFVNGECPNCERGLNQEGYCENCDDI